MKLFTFTYNSFPVTCVYQVVAEDERRAYQLLQQDNYPHWHDMYMETEFDLPENYRTECVPLTVVFGEED